MAAHRTTVRTCWRRRGRRCCCNGCNTVPRRWVCGRRYGWPRWRARGAWGATTSEAWSRASERISPCSICAGWGIAERAMPYRPCCCARRRASTRWWWKDAWWWSAEKFAASGSSGHWRATGNWRLVCAGRAQAWDNRAGAEATGHTLRHYCPKYPEISKIRCVGLLGNTLIDPAVVCTNARFMSTAPSSAFSVDTSGIVCPCGHNVRYPRGPGGTTVTLKTSRSEEHTSELQSLRHLVCRLLLEKKKKAT